MLRKSIVVIICGAKAMDERLAKAARDGNVNTLQNLMVADPEILEKESLGHSADSPLHIAARRGKAEFVKDIVSLMPSLATATNEKGLIPLHMASAQGHVETVKELLKAKLDDDEVMQCLVKEDDGWTPLHYAVFRGRVGVIKEFMRHCPECVEEVTAKGETVLHLAVKANQFKVVPMIVESLKRRRHFQTLLKAKDINGKTVYDLTAAKKQLQILELLKQLDDDEISEELFINVGSESEASNEEDKEIRNERPLQEDAVLVVATLLVTLTYQVMASPPSTFCKDGSTTIDWECLHLLKPPFFFLSSLKFLKECPAILAFWFMLFNTSIFFTSIFVVVVTTRLVLMQLVTVYLVLCYCVLLTAFCYHPFFYAFSIACIVLVTFIILRTNEIFGLLIKYFGKLATKWRRKDGYDKVPTSAT